MPKNLHVKWLYQTMAVFYCSFLLTWSDGYAQTAQDSIPADSTETITDSLQEKQPKIDFTDLPKKTVGASVKELSVFPAVSLQQSLKGQVPGLYIQESSGEPGTIQQMYIRGVPMPLFSAKEVYQSQPLVVLDGIPLIGEHPFAYDIQQYDFNRIGPATNLLTNIDMNNIATVEVLKDMAGMALYGPLAANGVILLTSKQVSSKLAIDAHAYFGVAQRPTVTTINGEYENNFRRQFYDLYTATGKYSEDDVYPLYLSDSLNFDYYGPSNWTDTYYKNGLQHGVTADISGGGDRANFRFSLGNLRQEGIADGTGLNRYSAMFHVNMKPLKWLLFSAMINGNRLDRQRNHNMRDRFAEVGYLPDLQAPLAPNNDIYSRYMLQYDNGFDNNYTNIIEGHAKLVADFDKFKYTTQLVVDYNEGYRDIFYPRPLLDGNSYASNYYGFSQRMIYENFGSYDWNINDHHHLYLQAGNILQWDSYKYNYAYAYKGVNDFIKLNLLESDPNNDNYLNPTAFPKQLVYKFLDRTKQNLVSFYGKASYKYDAYTVSLLLRTDGSSNAQPTERWLFTPALSLGWDIKEASLQENKVWSTLNLRLNAGRLGRLNAYDNFSQGPSYTADVTFTGNVTTPGYNGIATLNRPYNFGWVGYGIPWAYTDQLDLGVDVGLLNDRITASIDGYIKEDKNQLLGIPAYAEYGYSRSYEPGMSVRNTGVDLLLSAAILPKTSPRNLGWSASLNLNFNQNKLTALPRGLEELVIDNRLLRVGAPIDQYWLLTNDGMYQADEEVPQVDGVAQTYNGITLHGGDPIWRDLNGDNRINDEDKSLQGNIFPKVVGGFNNQFSYGNWSLGLNFYFNLGRKIINEEMANRFDFVNREGTINMSSVKEITFWEKRGDYNKYPLYNPWSTVIPYRNEQDLFLENGSFLKLRTISLGYDLSDWLKQMSSKVKRIYVYGTVNNVFTVSPYSGRDPELVNYTGYDAGYGMAIPRTYTLGFKMDL
ncbi:SusC/RagA family TonB-linked outer membrane protein [Olivibacter ginsenosidimutans]|uniref:SusC/RagA family TonB-linked outer membrane protein n=1 Tax=Olivibacter ginsenosidimutans TaxID=1176537 RepID=A0ABP9CDR2_9SPHI